MVRNRLKRLLREAFRQLQHEIPVGFDYLVILSPGLSGKPVRQVCRITLMEVKESFMQLVNRIMEVKR